VSRKKKEDNRRRREEEPLEREKAKKTLIDRPVQNVTGKERKSREHSCTLICAKDNGSEKNAEAVEL